MTRRIEICEKVKIDESFIYIMGLMRRTGTHFLIDLLRHHPECTKSVIPEDFLLASADLLNQYVTKLSSKWESNLKISDLKPADLLNKDLGDALISFLEEFRKRIFQREMAKVKPDKICLPPPRRLITKTPTIKGLKYFFQLFPNTPLIIIVRDGRATVESSIKSFGNDYETEIRYWADSVREVLEFDADVTKQHFNYLIIKYEDLYLNTEVEIRRILDFLKLDVNIYNFETALNLPVTGSSLFGRGDGKIHWTPIPKTDDFNPLARAEHWNRWQHERFNWLAGNELRALDYELKVFDNYNIYWKVWNKLQDFKWRLKQKLL